jgi:nucleotide-binding universal stress UspA family protein
MKGGLTMLPVKKILWTTDFSDPSYEALRAASELAHHFSAQLIVLHVIPPVPVLASTGHPGKDVLDEKAPSYNMELEALAREKLNQILDESVSKEIKTGATVLHGNISDEIVKFAEHENVDVIVTATHGESGWRRFLFGSVAEKVIRMAPCPVLSIQVQPEDS